MMGSEYAQDVADVVDIATAHCRLLEEVKRDEIDPPALKSLRVLFLPELSPRIT